MVDLPGSGACRRGRLAAAGALCDRLLAASRRERRDHRRREPPLYQRLGRAWRLGRLQIGFVYCQLARLAISFARAIIRSRRSDCNVLACCAPNFASIHSWCASRSMAWYVVRVRPAQPSVLGRCPCSDRGCDNCSATAVRALSRPGPDQGTEGTMTLRADTRSFLRGPLIRSPTRWWYGVLVDDAGAVV